MSSHSRPASPATPPSYVAASDATESCPLLSVSLLMHLDVRSIVNEVLSCSSCFLFSILLTSWLRSLYTADSLVSRLATLLSQSVRNTFSLEKKVIAVTRLASSLRSVTNFLTASAASSQYVWMADSLLKSLPMYLFRSSTAVL